MFNPREQCVSNVCFKIEFGKSVTGLGLAAVEAASRAAMTLAAAN
jgi:hypothetical protein